MRRAAAVGNEKGIRNAPGAGLSCAGGGFFGGLNMATQISNSSTALHRLERLIIIITTQLSNGDMIGGINWWV